MTSDVVVKQENNLPVASESEALMSLLERVAFDPACDVDKMRAVMDMKMELFNRGAEVEFNAAMARVQARIEPVARTADNSQTKSKYALLENIIQQCAPIWTAEGFALSFGTSDCPTQGHYRVTCVVSHSAGYSREYHADLPTDMTGIQGSVNKTGIHGFGSTTSYGRRYLTCMIFNIPLKGEDKDGNKPPSNVAMITDDQKKQIKDGCKIVGEDEKNVCKRAGVNSLDDFTAERAERAISWLTRKADKKVAQ